MLKPHKTYKFGFLFSQGDSADEIYFVQQGSYTMLIDVSDYIDMEEIGLDPESEAFNVPFNSYSAGSFFGDEDALCQIKKEDEDGQISHKRYRRSTVSALKDSDIMVIRRV